VPVYIKNLLTSRVEVVSHPLTSKNCLQQNRFRIEFNGEFYGEFYIGVFIRLALIEPVTKPLKGIIDPLHQYVTTLEFKM